MYPKLKLMKAETQYLSEAKLTQDTPVWLSTQRYIRYNRNVRICEFSLTMNGWSQYLVKLKSSHILSSTCQYLVQSFLHWFYANSCVTWRIDILPVKRPDKSSQKFTFTDWPTWSNSKWGQLNKS